MDDHFGTGTRVLAMPRGTPGLPPIQLDMSLIYEAESRLTDLKSVNQETGVELSAYYTQACNTVTKYLAWLEYELLAAEKHYGLAKATVILDLMPEAAQKLKESGIKVNEDVREAMIAKDITCQSQLERLNMLKAVQKLLEGKMHSFTKAHYLARLAVEKRQGIDPVPNLSGVVGETTLNENNFMGKAYHK